MGRVAVGGDHGLFGFSVGLSPCGVGSTYVARLREESLHKALAQTPVSTGDEHKGLRHRGLKEVGVVCVVGGRGFAGLDDATARGLIS